MSMNAETVASRGHLEEVVERRPVRVEDEAGHERDDERARRWTR